MNEQPMDSTTLFSGLAIVVIVVFVALWMRRNNGVYSPRHEPRSTRGGRPENAGRNITELLAQGRKIEAIKLYRELHGCGLKEAKEAIENFSEPAARPAAPRPVAAADDADIKQLLDEGNKIAAIKLYRERYQVSLKTAKEAVEKIS